MHYYIQPLENQKDHNSKVLLALQLFNPARYTQYVINKLGFTSFLRENKIEKEEHYFLPQGLENELAGFFEKFKNRNFKFFAVFGDVVIKTAYISLVDYKNLTGFVQETYTEAIKKDNYKESDLYIVITELIAFEFCGSIFRYFSEVDTLKYEIRASYGVIHNYSAGFDTYFVNPKNFKIIEKVVEPQDKMYLINQGKIKYTKLSSRAKDEQKITDKQIEDLARFSAKIEKIFKKPVEIYWGICAGKLYITSINPEFDGVWDYVDSQLNARKGISVLSDSGLVMEFLSNDISHTIAQEIQEAVKQETKSHIIHIAKRSLGAKKSGSDVLLARIKRGL